jgi:ADP-heptose:LPS heptosyltransferase
MNYLFSRTDRVGDLIVSSILLKSIKRNNSKNKIYIICSEYNSSLAKKLSFIDRVFIFKKGLFSKLKLLIKINFLKIDYMFILDGKDRSILFSFFVLAKKKLYILNKKKFSFFLNKSKENLIFDDELKDNKINTIQRIQKKIKINFSDDDTNIFKGENFLNVSNKDNLNAFNDVQYNLLHYDEKWIKELYIKSYKNIELDSSEINYFINSIVKKSNMDLVVTSGKYSTESLNNLKSTMIHQGNKIYIKKINNCNLYYVEQPDFFELIELIRKSKICITCHGAATHVSSSFNIKTIDVVDNSKILLYRAYTAHLKKYNEVIRTNPILTRNKILSLL